MAKLKKEGLRVMEATTVLVAATLVVAVATLVVAVVTYHVSREPLRREMGGGKNQAPWVWVARVKGINIYQYEHTGQFMVGHAGPSFGNVEEAAAAIGDKSWKERRALRRK